jgi:hypothetical protein
VSVSATVVEHLLELVVFSLFLFLFYHILLLLLLFGVAGIAASVAVFYCVWQQFLHNYATNTIAHVEWF